MMLLENIDINGIIEILLMIFSVGGIGYGYTKKLGLEKVLAFFDYDNKDVTTAPTSVVNASKTGNLYKMSYREKNKIFDTLNIAEQNSLISLISQYESNGEASYKLNTSKGTYEICFGFIDVDPTEEGHPIAPDTTSMSSNGNTIGNMKVQAISINGIELNEGSEIIQADIVGKPLNVLLSPEKYGEVIIGAFFDNKLLNQNFTNISLSEKDNKKYQIQNFEIPPYDSVASVGEHEIEIKIGYYSGVNDLDKDVTIWKEDLTKTFKVVII